MVIQPTRQPLALLLRFMGGVALVLFLTLLVFFLVMRPPSAEVRDMTRFLSVTALVSLVAGYTAYRWGWISRSPQIKWTLVAGYALSTALTFINVWVTARLMFINQHDLTLATILLVFAAGIAVALGFFLSATLTDNIDALNKGASAIAGGRLDTRIDVPGNDEVAELAHTFNAMAAQLEEADRRQREVDLLRRNLIAWVGHDLRTPLASVRAIVEALADHMVDDPETVDRYLRTAKRDIGALSMLIDDLFDMAQIDAGGIQLDRQPNALSDLISDTLESHSALANAKGIELEGEVTPGVDPVSLDARQIGRVLTNLVGNAVRHTPQGGSVHVRAWPNSGMACVEVRDSGEGISAEDLPHVFEQFYRAEQSRSRATGGSGLGLAIARGLVEAHGGTIQVQSQSTEGTSFFFTLPRLSGRKAANPLLRTLRPEQTGTAV